MSIYDKITLDIDFSLIRFKACKFAENLYARLAALTALQSYGIYLPTIMAAVLIQHILSRYPDCLNHKK